MQISMRKHVSTVILAALLLASLFGVLPAGGRDSGRDGAVRLSDDPPPAAQAVPQALSPLYLPLVGAVVQQRVTTGPRH